jgi:hypothetical protein
MKKIAGSESKSGSISQRHGSVYSDPDPEPRQNVMDSQTCFQVSIGLRGTALWVFSLLFFV